MDLEKVLIPASVTEIGEDAFKDCEKLTIFAPGGSYAETYAGENGIHFSAIWMNVMLGWSKGGEL